MQIAQDSYDLRRIENIPQKNGEQGKDMFSLGKARNTLERWFNREEDQASLSTHEGDALSRDEEGAADRRVQQFMEELGANSQEWLGRVRMISFDSIRERVGPRWTQLRNRVEILGEKIIREEMAPRDRYVNAGDAEFLVFFADATLEESRIRCLAIVEMIHEKLFGVEDDSHGGPQTAAECHVIHKNDFILEWELAASDPDGAFQGGAARALRKAFRQDREVADGGDIAASAQAVIDTIIARAAETKDMSELPECLTRLRYFSRSLKMLEPALVAAVKEHANAGESQALSAAPLGTAWDDIVSLIAALDADADNSHADALEQLRNLQRARLAKAMAGLAEDDLSRGKRLSAAQFGYIPIYRLISKGERIHQGLYRISCARLEEGADDDDAATRDRRRAALERMILQHAIQYLLDRKSSQGCMLLAPVSVETLRSPSTQRQYSTVLRSAQLRAKKRLLIGVVGYSQADNTLGMRRAIDELRLHSRAIFITVTSRGRADIENIVLACKVLGAHAVGIDTAQVSRSANTLAVVSDLASIGLQHSILTYVDGIRRLPVLAKAVASGISYVGAPGLRPALPAPEDVERANFDDLYLPV
jgi:hypothetical protein